MHPAHIYLRSFTILSVITRLQSSTEPSWITKTEPNVVYFIELGKVIGSLHYAHFSYDYHIGQLYRTIETLCTHQNVLLNNEQFINLKWWNYFDPNFLREVQLLETYRCEDMIDRYNDVLSSWTEGTMNDPTDFLRKHRLPYPVRNLSHSIVKRFVPIGPILGLGSALVTLISSALLTRQQVTHLIKHPEDHTIKVLQDHETTLAFNDKSIQLIKDSLNDIANRLTNMDHNQLLLKTIFLRDYAESKIYSTLDILGTFPSHHVEPGLIRPEIFHEELQDLAMLASRSGITLLSTSPAATVKFESCFAVFQNDTTRIYTHVPGYKEAQLLRLFKFNSIPFALNDTHFALAKPPKDVLAVDEAGTLYRTLSSEELRDCKMYAGLRYCENANYFHKKGEDCLVALYESDMDKIKAHCELIIQPKQDFLTQINETHFMMFHAESQNIDVSCPDRPSQQSRFKGLRMVRLDPGCQASTKTFTFEAPLSITKHMTQVITRDIDISTWVGAVTALTQVRPSMDSMDLMNSPIAKETLNIRNMQDLLEKSQGQMRDQVHMGWGFSAFLILTILTVVVVAGLCVRRRITSLRSKLVEFIPLRNNPAPAPRIRAENNPMLTNEAVKPEVSIP